MLYFRQEDANIWLKEKGSGLCFLILHVMNLLVWPCRNIKWIDRIDWKWAEKTENQQFFLDLLEKGGHRQDHYPQNRRVDRQATRSRWSLVEQGLFKHKLESSAGIENPNSNWWTVRGSFSTTLRLKNSRAIQSCEFGVKGSIILCDLFSGNWPCSQNKYQRKIPSGF